MTNIKNSSKTPYVAVIGSGYWGKNLVRNFHQLGALKIICDKDRSILPNLHNDYPNIEIVTELDEVLKRDNIQGAVISTPAETHYHFTKKALLAGKHVFVEKPLALTESEGEELVEISNTNQLTLMVGHILHYHPAIIKLKDMIDSGDLGKLQYIYSNRLNIGKIRTEENILWSFAPHDISAILMLLGEFPSTIRSWGGNWLQPHLEDVTMTTLDFPSGVKGHIFVSWLHPFKEQKLIVVGDKKMAVFNDVSEEKLFLYSHTIKWQQRQPVAVKASSEIVSLSLAEPLKAECQHFLDCVSNGQIPKTDGKEALRVLKVLNACEISLQEKGKEVQLFSEPNSIPKADSAIVEKEHYFVHESSIIDENVTIGNGTKIWHFSHVISGTEIGENCRIGQNVVIGPDVLIGNGCKIQNNVSVYKGVTLEDEVFCGPSMVFTNVYNPRAAIPRMSEIKPTLIKKGTSIGANATIICGVTIGRYAFIGAGSVVTKDVKNHALMVGNPAQQTGWICECGVKLNADFVCTACGKGYSDLEE